MDELDGVVDELIALVLVVEAGGFNTASMRHHIPASRLSRRIASLEKRLGVSLLVRSSRRFRVTEIGERMVLRRAGSTPDLGCKHSLAVKAPCIKATPDLALTE
jgi:hypothetical protein